VVTAAAVAGFLLMNWPPARAYLGDGGAYVLGGTLSALVLSADSNPATTGAAVAAALVAGGTLGIFLVDLAVTLLRRRAAGAPLLIGDRSHLYDQLADRGWRPGQVAAAVGAVQLCFAALALGADRLLGGWPAVLAVTAGFALVLAALWRAGFVVARAG
jgi:UDP-N-acetylmuramyl pentapeptide phosphotransferase/UDP-N-acetylglucosamine-1-phosphate transferase